MNLGQIFVRGAFKNQAHRALELSSGSSAQVFEVTDLLIPAGTDWSTLGRELGTLAPDWWSLLIYTIWVEVDNAVTDGRLILDISDDADWSVSNNLDLAQITAVDSNLWVLAHGVTAVAEPSGGFIGPATATSGPSPVFSVSLHTPDGPTTEDITIVRARAAFLVI